jgi:hypothetical protein
MLYASLHFLTTPRDLHALELLQNVFFKFVTIVVCPWWCVSRSQSTRNPRNLRGRKRETLQER